MLKSVLVIDDSDADLLYTRIILERSGAVGEVLTFGSAVEALAHLEAPGVEPVDVILLDINMPEMNGFAFLQAYEAGDANHHARAVVVMLTTSPDPHDQTRAFSYASVRSYVVKPIDVASARGLIDVVEQAPPFR